MRSSHPFDLAAQLEHRGDHRYRGRTPPEWRSAGGRPQGGFIAAQLLLAMTHSIDDPARRPRSITTHFPNSPSPDPYMIECTIERTGRTVTNISARCVQNGRVQAMAMGVFAIDRDGIHHDDLAMPDIGMPGPDRRSTSWWPNYAFPFADQVVSQHRSGPGPFSSPDAPMETAGWVGFAEPRPFDAAGLLVLCDAGMMPFWARIDTEVATATLDYTLHFRANFPIRSAEGMAAVANTTRLVDGGLLDWDVVAWASDGTPLCFARQQAIVLDDWPRQTD